MLNFKKMNKILHELEKKKMFNKFIANLLDYDLKELDKIIIRYKIINELIIDIFDYKNGKKFTRYYFTTDIRYKDQINDDIIIKVVNIKNNNKNNNDKLSIFSSLFYEKDLNILKNNLTKLFDKEIKYIIMKYL